LKRLSRRTAASIQDLREKATWPPRDVMAGLPLKAAVR
jgi:hypothetical protein